MSDIYTYNKLAEIYESQKLNVQFDEYLSERLGIELPSPTDENPNEDFDALMDFIGGMKLKITPWEGGKWNLRFERINIDLVEG